MVLFILLSVFLPVVYLSVPPISIGGARASGVSLPPFDIVGGYGSTDAPSGADRTEPQVIAPPGASGPKAQMVTPQGDGRTTAPVVLLQVETWSWFP